MGRKKHVTYDSQETLTVLGLILMLVGIFFFISIISSNENETNLFTQAKNIFGYATIFTTFFLFNIGLRLLKINYVLNTTKSLIGQAVLLFILPAFLTAFGTSPRELSRNIETTGGTVGYFIVEKLFNDTLPFEDQTRIVLFLGALIALPLSLSMSLEKIVNFIVTVIKFIFRGISSFINPSDDELDVEEEHNSDSIKVVERATTFGDFNNVLKQKQAAKVKDETDRREQEKQEKTENLKMKALKPLKIARGDNSVEIKEGSIGEDGLKQETLKYPDWELPPLSLLIPYKKTKAQEPAIDQNARIIEQILVSFGIEAKVEDAFVGPSVIQYALNIPLGIKVAKVSTLSENIALALGVDSKAVRIESIPETTYLGIEVPRSKRDMVRFKELMESDDMLGTTKALPIPIGKNINGNAVISDIQRMPHLLIAGATGSGKSVLTNSFIASVLMNRTPDEVKFILVDPKQVELSDYNGIPHLLTPVITDMDHVVNALKWAVKEMEKRYTNLAKEQVRNIEGFNNKKGFAAMPYIVIVIDEMADMMMTANRVEAETAIVRLAQKARAVGIHLILATQRPSVNVITGIIKANIPGRIGMSVTSSTDSRVILDRIGSESLLGYGDLLYKAPDKPKSVRLQGALIDQEEIIRIVDFLKSQAPEVEYVNEILEKQAVPGEETGVMGEMSDDNLMEQAIRIVVQSQKGSSSFLQRRLNIGFNRAARLLEELEEMGVVGGSNGSKPREVLISDADSFIQSLRGGPTE